MQQGLALAEVMKFLAKLIVNIRRLNVTVTIEITQIH